MCLIKDITLSSCLLFHLLLKKNHVDILLLILREFKRINFYSPWNHHKTTGYLIHLYLFTVACRVQIWKNTFSQNSDKFDYSFIKVTCLCIYFAFIKKPIILTLFKIDTLNFTMYIWHFDIPFIYAFHYILRFWHAL